VGCGVLWGLWEWARFSARGYALDKSCPFASRVGDFSQKIT
jgi:hypothetical protein